MPRLSHTGMVAKKKMFNENGVCAHVVASASRKLWPISDKLC
jgi:hypothetical protein